VSKYDKRIAAIERRISHLEDPKTVANWPITTVHERIEELAEKRAALTKWKEKRQAESLGTAATHATLRLDSRDKFFAALEALQQYIDNGEDADHLSDDPALQAKLEAASCLRDQLDAVLASLAR
jgi:chromosome segregation ATPase